MWRLQGRGRVWEAIIKGGEILLSECNTGEVDSFTKHILIDSSNGFTFAFCELKKPNSFSLEYVFNLCIPQGESLCGLCSFSLKCAGRALSETQPMKPRWGSPSLFLGCLGGRWSLASLEQEMVYAGRRFLR